MAHVRLVRSCAEIVIMLFLFISDVPFGESIRKRGGSVKLNHQAVIGLFLVPHGPPNQQNSRHPMSMFHSSQETLETLSDWAESPEDAVQFLGKACKARHGIAIDDEKQGLDIFLNESYWYL